MDESVGRRVRGRGNGCYTWFELNAGTNITFKWVSIWAADVILYSYVCHCKWKKKTLFPLFSSSFFGRRAALFAFSRVRRIRGHEFDSNNRFE